MATRLSDAGRCFQIPPTSTFATTNHSFQSLAAFRSGESRLSVRDPDSAGQAAQRAQGHMVSGNYFLTLGVNPLLGRLLNPSDDSPEARPAAVNQLWILEAGLEERLNYRRQKPHTEWNVLHSGGHYAP